MHLQVTYKYPDMRQKASCTLGTPGKPHLGKIEKHRIAVAGEELVLGTRKKNLSLAVHADFMFFP
jgi:hypothetical protein